MKTFLRLAFLSCLLLLQTVLFANTVIVKGTVKDSANNFLSGRTVKIYSTDSTNGGCALYHTVTTNPNGYYIDTLKCTGDIRKLYIIVENCNGTTISRDPAVTSTGVVECNFIICAPQPATLSCKAAFSYTSLATGVKFNAAGSSTVSGDSIISRTWLFGDSSTSLTGNQVDPTHNYAKAGIYQVCLTIKTKKGCESNYCQAVVYTPASNDCKAEAIFTAEKTAAKQFRFNSIQSNTLAGDSIFQRIWKFGDGSSLDGNQVNPLKQYKDTGIYNVCLTVKTAKGCEKQYCMTIVVKDSVTIPTTGCKALFSFSSVGRNAQFNSKNSIAPGGDSIISRTWLFGDNTAALTGNRIDPTHSFNKAGTYTVCLYIKTKGGCESKICAEVIIRDTLLTPTNCQAYFTYKIKDSLIYFSSAASKATSDSDQIISRTWYYTGSGISVSLGGNVIDTFYKFAQPGTYPVTLVVKTKAGCESRFTANVVVPAPPPPPTGCKAYFTYQIKDSVIYFSSAASKASSDSDKIISRTWYYTGNGVAVSLGGNVTDTFYRFTTPGSYPVTLVIKTKAGCESKFTGTVVVPPPPVPTGCKAVFAYTAQNGTVKFNSKESKGVNEQDTILSRVWIFGDSTAPMQGNIIDPTHIYTKAGKYTVTLYIKTKSGCESKYQLVVTINSIDCPVDVKFTTERVSLKKIQFNSSMSAALPGDSIIQRNWKFGDNTVLSGNEIKPLKEFPLLGIYNTCLQVKTLNGCQAQECKQVILQDTLNRPQASNDFIKIININPNPVITKMMATIYSRNANVEAEITIYDIYGLPKLTLKRSLLQGNNIIEINCESLRMGPYFLTVSTKTSGKDSKAFYKL